jgi:hypothetical protein
MPFADAKKKRTGADPPTAHTHMGSVPSSSLSRSAHSAANPPHAFSTPAYMTTPCMRSHSSANQRNAPSETSSAAFHHSSPVRQ